MYKALIDIGDFKEGEIVPTEKAVIWKEMYKVSPVVKVSEEEPKEELEEVSEEKSEEKESGSILNDYLARGKNVVIKNIQSDDLSAEQLSELLELEKSDKERKGVLSAINKRLGNIN